MRVMETVDGHCGYEFSWSPYRLLPFSGSSEYHNFHKIQHHFYPSLYSFISNKNIKINLKNIQQR